MPPAHGGGRRPGRRPGRGRWRTVAIEALVLLIAAEVALRLTGGWYLRTHYYQPRAQQIAGKEVIVCLGESSTAGLWCQFEDSYPKQLERLLNERFHTDRFLTVVPPHIGQNTSQIANRVESYIQLYHPRLIIVMSGVNNLWALGESSAGRFFSGSWRQTLPLRLSIALDRSRLYKVLRYGVARAGVRPADDAARQRLYLQALGHPALMDWPAAQREAVSDLARRYQMEAFLEAWRYDMRRLIRTARQHHVGVLVMTYHLPGFPPVEEFVRMADAEHVPLVRNDLAFAALRQAPDYREENYLLHDHWHPNARGYRLIAEGALAGIGEHHLPGD